MWLVVDSYFRLMEHAHRRGFVETAEHRVEIEALQFGPARISSIQGNTATIAITGILTQEPDIIAMMFGGGNTTYPEIIGALAAADANDKVENISIFIDSPGGQVSGMFQAMDAIRDTTKPTSVLVGNMAASAAFGLASQADTIIASHRSSRVGSIGTVNTMFTDDNEITISSDNAPAKAPDPKTDVGVSAIKEELNEIAALLDEGIAEGRSTTVKKVNANFGKGGMVLAESAIEKGMIDGIAIPIQSINQNAARASARSTKQEALTMDLAQLQSEHAAVFAEAVALGVSQEQERVTAHLSSGEACGDMSIAMKAIQDGLAYGHPTTAAAYANAAMRLSHINANIGDDKDLDNAANGNAAPPKSEASEQDAIAEQVLASVEASFGVRSGDRDFIYLGGAK